MFDVFHPQGSQHVIFVSKMSLKKFVFSCEGSLADHGSVHAPFFFSGPEMEQMYLLFCNTSGKTVLQARPTTLMDMQKD